MGSRGSGTLGGLLGAGEGGVGGEQTDGLARGGDLETTPGGLGGPPLRCASPKPWAQCRVPALERAVGVESRPDLSPSHRRGRPRTSGEIGVFRHVAPPTRLGLELPHETGLTPVLGLIHELMAIHHFEGQPCSSAETQNESPKKQLDLNRAKSCSCVYGLINTSTSEFPFLVSLVGKDSDAEP